MHGCRCLGAKDRTPEIDTSEIIVAQSKTEFIVVLLMDKISTGFSLAASNGCSVAFSDGTPLFGGGFPKECHLSSGCVLELSN